MRKKLKKHLPGILLGAGVLTFFGSLYFPRPEVGAQYEEARRIYQSIALRGDFNRSPKPLSLEMVKSYNQLLRDPQVQQDVRRMERFKQATSMGALIGMLLGGAGYILDKRNRRRQERKERKKRLEELSGVK